MTPEKKERLVAEAEKLRAEAASLKKGGWGRPSSWVPMLAAIAAIATSIGQCQVSSINQREAALVAREKVVEAKEEEKQLKERNAKLEQKAKELTGKIAKSTSESLQLEEEIKKANEQLLAFAREKDLTKAQIEKVEKEVSDRMAKAESITAAAKRRNAEATIQNLVWQMNSELKATRLAAVKELIEVYKSNDIAISSAIELITMPQLDSLSSSGRINVLVFLRNTEPSSWNKDLKLRAESALDEIRERAEKGRAYIGPQTEEAITKLDAFLDSKAHNNAVN